MPLASNWNAQGISYNAILLESGVAHPSQRTASPGLLIYYYRGLSNYLTPGRSPAPKGFLYFFYNYLFGII